MSDRSLDRRTFVKGVGATAGAAALAGQAGASSQVSTRVLDRQFDLAGGTQEALVVFDDIEDAARLDSLDLAKGYHEFEHVDTAWTFLDPDQLETVAGWDSVRRVKKAEELEWLNTANSRESMNVAAVQADDRAPTFAGESGEVGYRGQDRHVVVIDSGIDASHPAVSGRVEANYHYVDDPFGARDAMWVDAGPGDTDRIGHGTHCAGIVGGDGGGGHGGDYAGMAPAVTLTGYSVGQTVYLPYVVGAWNHLLGRIKTEPDFNPDAVSNSYGVTRNNQFNPNDPVNLASWRVFQEGVLPVWAMGNDYDLGTGNRFAKAPYILGVAATDDTITTTKGELKQNRSVAGFSSRGRAHDDAKAEQEPTKYIADKTLHDRAATFENIAEFHAIQDNAPATVDSGSFSGTVGAGANSSPGVEAVDEEVGVAYETLGTFENVDLASLTLSLEPQAQWVRLRVFNGDGEKVAVMREEPLKQHSTLTFDVEGGTDYTIELEPEVSAGAEYTIDYELASRAGDTSLAEVRDAGITLYRPGIGTHGEFVLSSVDPHDALGQLGPLYAQEDLYSSAPEVGEGGEEEPLYTYLSGTSMACPAGAGIVALVRQAYTEASGGNEMPPRLVLRALEHAARNRNPTYTDFNVGAGHVHAADAVRIAERLGAGETVSLDTGLDALVTTKALTEAELKPPEPVSVTADGSREDDGDVFTGGQTNRVQVTLDSVDVTIPDGGENTEANDATLANQRARVRDEVPEGWTVDEEFSDGSFDPEANVVDFGTVELTDDGSLAADSVSFEYYAEAPSGAGNSDRGEFGPATVTVAFDDVEYEGNETVEAEFTGSDPAYVVGVGTEL